MKAHKLFAVFALIFSIGAGAQNLVRIHVTSLPSYSITSDSLFMAGSFNSWDPHDIKYLLTRETNGGYTINLKLLPGQYEFKITRGFWDKVESGKNGFPVENHLIKISSDTSIAIVINEWADHFPKKPRLSTASKQVKIISTAFYIPQLDRYRRVWVYLPSSYQHSTKFYPVLWMHDGQNLFEDSSSFSGEWGIDEALDSLGSRYGEMIVVAVDHGGEKRFNEYSPYGNERFGKGEGDAYVDFIVKTLKPYIQHRYRTINKASGNYIAGSSMGGVISLYAILKYPDEFGGAGIFSPAFWITPQIKTDVIKNAAKVKGKVYFYAGKLESETMVQDMLSVFDEMQKRSKAKMKTVIRDDGKHNESTWRREFPLFYKWLQQGR
jgi:predicted alpha/beta superfamily hydrolase